ncbi:melanoma antigen preferentially expressed in tumors-like [Hippopotamus amphibius kiboko]|uniref:melanoma antigen preferentially expressed in tumors-like n=1 Tax=Hippopotamus amphibius kiboko TaxID=575201 RepID=UPI00259570CF|nr:melanoma antigen preferentially expressed in tumors-like [Hippopotamus amphibius kiboko]
MEMPYLGTLQAVPDGLDVLLAQKDRPRRCKLRALDLRNTGQDFWSVWSGSNIRVSSSSLMAPVTEDRSRTEQPLAPLQVFIELCLSEGTMDGFFIYLVQWVEKRKVSVHLCCKKLKIVTMPMENIMKVLSMVQLDCTEEVQVNCTWHLSTLAMFAPLLGQMSNVQRLFLSRIHLSALDGQEEHHIVQITSRFLRLHHLWDIRMKSPSFFQGRLDQILRCLKTPLDNLTITHCLLTESDLTHLSQGPNISQLKGLDLSGVTLTNFSPELLQVLLEKVAATLQELDLDLCGIMDSQLDAILPVLTHCSKLRTFSLYGNLLSMAVMAKILHHTDGLPGLILELYPAPRESYNSQRILHLGRLAQFQAELIDIMSDLGRPRNIWISSNPCPRWGNEIFYHEKTIIYCCFVPS